MIALALAGALVAGFVVGYLVAVARTPRLLARMTEAEIRALGERVFDRKHGG